MHREKSQDIQSKTKTCGSDWIHAFMTGLFNNPHMHIA